MPGLRSDLKRSIGMIERGITIADGVLQEVADRDPTLRGMVRDAYHMMDAIVQDLGGIEAVLSDRGIRTRAARSVPSQQDFIWRKRGPKAGREVGVLRKGQAFQIFYGTSQMKGFRPASLFSRLTLAKRAGERFLRNGRRRELLDAGDVSAIKALRWKRGEVEDPESGRGARYSKERGAERYTLSVREEGGRWYPTKGYWISKRELEKAAIAWLKNEKVLEGLEKTRGNAF